MSFLDGLKDKAEEFGERAKDGLAAAKDKAVDLAGDAKEKASGLVEDVRDRFEGDVALEPRHATWFEPEEGEH